MTIKDIYQGAENLINQLIRVESGLQGHTLTGNLENSLTSTYSKLGKSDLMEGFAINYMKYVDNGVPAASASMKQFPFVKA